MKIDPSRSLGRRRVICSICPVEQNYQPDRQTILFDARTGIVTDGAGKPRCPRLA